MSTTLNYSFSGKRVLITGGGRGIGYQIAKSFYDDGAIVFIIDKDLTLLENVKETMPKAQTFCVDLLNWNQTRETVLSMAPLDHLVNNAGIAIVKFCVDFTEDDCDKMFGINVKSVLNVSNAFIKGLVEKNQSSGGTIVNISSVADRLVIPGAALYCTTKAAVTMLTRSMASEFYVYNVRVNCVCPGFVATKLIENLPEPFGTQITENLIGSKEIVKTSPITTQDVANQVLYLSSPLSANATGSALTMDAGLSL